MSKSKTQILVKAGGSGANKVGSTKPKIILKKDKVKQQKEAEKKREEERRQKEEAASRVYTFEEKLRGYAYRKIGKTTKKVDLIASKEAFTSAEEVYASYSDLSYERVLEVWRTFHGPTTGIPIAYIERFEPFYQKV